MNIRLHSIETLGALDGPGIRTVLFLQGCTMRCKYCHNPDSWDSSGGTEKSISELTAFCARYKNYYGKNGGVTLSGGEPLFQRTACLHLIESLASKGIFAALDTGGSIFAPEVFLACNLVILDIKHTDAAAFKQLTGVENTNLLRTLAFLRENHRRFWVRQVIVPGYTDSEEQVLALKHMAEGAEKIELLPYHTLGRAKWESLGVPYPLEGVAQTDSATVKRLENLLKPEKAPRLS